MGITLMAVYKLNTNKIENCFQNCGLQVRDYQYAAAEKLSVVSTTLDEEVVILHVFNSKGVKYCL